MVLEFQGRWKAGSDKKAGCSRPEDGPCSSPILWPGCWQSTVKQKKFVLYKHFQCTLNGTKLQSRFVNLLFHQLLKSLIYLIKLRPYLFGYLPQHPTQLLPIFLIYWTKNVGWRNGKLKNDLQSAPFRRRGSMLSSLLWEIDCQLLSLGGTMKWK